MYERRGSRVKFLMGACVLFVCTTLQTSNMKLNLFVQSHLKVDQKLLEYNIPVKYHVTEAAYPDAERLCGGGDATDTTINRNRQGTENKRSGLFLVLFSNSFLLLLLILFLFFC